MPKNVAMPVPGPGIVGIEYDGDAGFARHQDGVAERSIEQFAVDLSHLKRVTVKVHGVRHGGFVDELQRHPLTGLYPHLGRLTARLCRIEDDAVYGPFVSGHIPLQPQLETLIDGLGSRWISSDEPALHI